MSLYHGTMLNDNGVWYVAYMSVTEKNFFFFYSALNVTATQKEGKLNQRFWFVFHVHLPDAATMNKITIFFFKALKFRNENFLTSFVNHKRRE
jgi:hypothetical protein